MTQTFTSTQNDIIRYIYNETSNSENVLIEESLLIDTEVLDFYLDCLTIKTDLNKIKLQPRQSTVNNILMYSQNYKTAI